MTTGTHNMQTTYELTNRGHAALPGLSAILTGAEGSRQGMMGIKKKVRKCIMGEYVVTPYIREGAAEEAKSRQKGFMPRREPRTMTIFLSNNEIDVFEEHPLIMFYGCDSLLGTQSSNKYYLHQGRNVRFLLKLIKRPCLLCRYLLHYNPTEQIIDQNVYFSQCKSTVSFCMEASTYVHNMI